MAPHLKARELILKMCIDLNTEDVQQGYESCTPKNEYYKQCALIAVDEIFAFMENDDKESDVCYWANSPTLNYWYNVKQEIEKL